MQIGMPSNSLVQSPYLYLQSAGSKGEDGIPEGMHLRWALMNYLGDNHLPKGNYANNHQFFNKPDDFVNIYRAPYDEKFPATLDLNAKAPDNVVDNDRLWVFLDVGNEGLTIYMWFKDGNVYDNVRNSYNPYFEPLKFMKDYGNNLVEVEVKDRLFFATEIGVMNDGDDPSLKAEAISVKENVDLPEKVVSCRRVFNPASNNNQNNLLTNPDFEGGDNGFQSDYPPNTGGYGTYYIVNNASSVGNWSSTPHSGSLHMVIDGEDQQQDQAFWRQTVNVNQHTKYQFSGWLYNNSHDLPPFEIDILLTDGGGNSSTFTAMMPADKGWKRFDILWDSEFSQQVTIEMINNNLVAIGNDFAIDDLYFGGVDKSEILICSDEYYPPENQEGSGGEGGNGETTPCGEGPVMINNPSFEGGNNGFTNDFNYSQAFSNGDYYITTDAQNLGAETTGENGGGSDQTYIGLPHSGNNFLAINTFPTEEEKVLWQQETAVQPYKRYCLCGFVSALTENSNATITIRITGLEGDGYVEEKTIQVPPNPGEWHPFFLSFYSNNNSGVSIQIIDANTSGEDYALGLDSLYFGECSLEPRSEDGCGQSPNKINNSGFEDAANQNFNTDFQESSDFSTGLRYSIISDASTDLAGGTFTGTPLEGNNFFAGKGFYESEYTVWEKAFSIDPFMNYCFCGFLSNLNSDESPEINIYIFTYDENGNMDEVLASRKISAPTSTNEWRKFFLRINKSGHSEIGVKITNVMGSGSTGAFGLDKLYLGICDEYGTGEGSYKTICGGRMVSENIQSVRFKAFDSYFAQIKVETYQGFIEGKNSSDAWTDVNSFALTENTTTAYTRLEDQQRFTVHDQWPKYNDGAKVDVGNYQTRWSKADGILHGVTEYINLSDQDPKATKVLSNSNDIDGDIEVSYLDMVNLISYDYHVARMLGLGYIDLTGTSATGKYIFVAEYVSMGDLNDGQGDRQVNHIYSTFPISKNMERLPEEPSLSSLGYGIYDENGNLDQELTDSNGYTPGNEQARYTSLFLEQNDRFRELTPFFNPSEKFCITNFTPNVFLGIEYKKQGESSWRKPEISHEDNYTDTDEIKETKPIPNHGNETKPIFIHKETEEGVHLYAPYGVNWFARPSQVGNDLLTDSTAFTKANTLLPPHNFHAQIIQPEDPLVLTSQDDQNKLSDVQNNNNTPLVRVTFDYNHVHDLMYKYGDEIELFFRTKLPENIQGGVKSVIDDPNDSQKSIIRTQDYHLNSTNETLSPSTTSYSSYIGGIIVINNQRFIIDNASSSSVSNEGPVFTVFKIKNWLGAPGEEEGVQTDPSYQAPEETDPNGSPARFMAIENMADINNWPNPKFKPFSSPENVIIDDSQWTVKTETFNKNGRTVNQEVRGIWEMATISESQDLNLGQTSGVYEITFDNFHLNNHIQFSTSGNSVNWYQGIVRVPKKVSNDLKELKVVKIENWGSGSGNTKLYAVDETHNPNPDPPPDPDNVALVNAEVNFYPGYKVYLIADSNAGFTESNVIPSAGEKYEDSLLGARTVDTDQPNNYYSGIGKPSIIRAQEFIDPKKPNKPVGGQYATRPDYYNKATYTLTVNFQHKPFATVFYRANEESILNVLYKKTTIGTIKSNLGTQIEQRQRWEDLISFDYQGNTNGDFITYDGYHLPPPDNDAVNPAFDGSTKPKDIESEIKNAVLSIFTPLTPKPLIYDQINGPGYQPKLGEQVIRDEDGNLLPPEDMDLAPMAKKTQGSADEVQFTDFTLDGASSNLYFYCAREIGSQNSLGPYSDISGPIQLINTNPPKKPDVKQVTSQLADPVSNEPPKINFKLNNYDKFENVKKITIYRTNNSVDANNVKSMTEVKTIDLEAEGILSDPVFTVQDDFPNVSYPLFGESLFYRLVALREIVNENDNKEYVPSQPSDLLLTNVVDNTNPPAPEITANYDTENNPPKLTDVDFEWPKTAHNATYYLYKMNEKGNWNKIYEKTTNADPVSVALSNTSWGSNELNKEDSSGNTIYHRFKVEVENASGLLNLEDKELTL